MGAIVLDKVSQTPRQSASSRSGPSVLKRRGSSDATFASRIKDLAEFARGSDSCATQANGRPRSAPFHYYFRCHLLLRRAIVRATVSRSHDEREERKTLKRGVPTFARDRWVLQFVHLRGILGTSTPRRWSRYRRLLNDRPGQSRGRSSMAEKIRITWLEREKLSSGLEWGK